MHVTKLKEAYIKLYGVKWKEKLTKYHWGVWEKGTKKCVEVKSQQ